MQARTTCPMVCHSKKAGLGESGVASRPAEASSCCNTAAHTQKRMQHIKVAAGVTSMRESRRVARVYQAANQRCEAVS